MPSYIFLEPVPLTVTYRGITYRMEVHQVMHNIWRLSAAFGTGASSWFLAESGSDAKLMLAIHSAGVEIRAGTVPEGIFQLLVKEGRAQLAVARPRPDLPPAARGADALGAGAVLGQVGKAEGRADQRQV